MQKHALKLLVLSMVLAPTPATAGNQVAASRPHPSACPYQRARLAAAALARSRAQQAKGPTIVTLIGIPSDRSLPRIVRGSSLAP